MAEPVEIFRYIRYLGLRWIWIAVSGAVAVTLAAGVSLWMTRQYTATARILIEPPAGADLRSAMAVSPIYLESLKTYEHFASGDSLFQRAANRFGLRQMFGGQPLESIKKRVLRVGIVRNTRILEISATLPDARKAQALAQFVGQATVDLTRSVVSEGDRDLIGGIEEQEQQARAARAGNRGRLGQGGDRGTGDRTGAREMDGGAERVRSEGDCSANSPMPNCRRRRAKTATMPTREARAHPGVAKAGPAPRPTPRRTRTHAVAANGASRSAWRRIAKRGRRNSPLLRRVCAKRGATRAIAGSA